MLLYECVWWLILMLNVDFIFIFRDPQKPKHHPFKIRICIQGESTIDFRQNFCPTIMKLNVSLFTLRNKFKIFEYSSNKAFTTTRGSLVQISQLSNTNIFQYFHSKTFWWIRILTIVFCKKLLLYMLYFV